MKILSPICAVLALFLYLNISVHAQESDGFYVNEPEFGARVYMLEAGKSHQDTVVLVHGLGDLGSSDWNDVIPMLSKHYHVIAIDLPGFAKSEKGNHLYSPTRYARFLKWVVDQYGSYRNQHPITMIGHSMGGAIALRYASMYPETLTRLVLVDAAGILHRSAFASATVRHASNRVSWSEGLTSTLKDVGKVVGEAIIGSEKIKLPVDGILSSAAMRTLFLRGNPSIIAALALLQEDFSRAIDELQVPTTIIWGENDGVAPLRTGRLLHARLNRVTLDLIADSAHVPMKEQTTVFNGLLLERLTQIIPEKVKAQEPLIGLKDMTCTSEKNMQISGSYRDIIIKDCSGVVLENVTARQIQIENSDVDMYRTRISSSQTGLIVRKSKLVATALDIDAKTGILSSASRLDLAGVSIRGEYNAIVAADIGASKASTAVISVSRLQGQHMHGTYMLAKKGESFTYFGSQPEIPLAEAGNRVRRQW
ncbi:MAG: alpha/beta hydrolase [Mariprofundaceae bacterium]